MIHICKCRHVQASHRLGECTTCHKLGRYRQEARPEVCRGFDESYCRCWHVEGGHDPITGVCGAAECGCEAISPLDALDQLVKYNEMAFARAKRRAEVREMCGWSSPGTAPAVYVPYHRPVWEG